MKNYKNLLEKAQKAYKNCVTGAEKRRLESIFPELKESEDDIFKELIYNLIVSNDNTPSSKEIFSVYGKTKEDCLAWLEKQGEQGNQHLYDIIIALWDLLDKIDTFADLQIDDTSRHNPFRKIEDITGERHKFVKSDGYNLYIKGEKITDFQEQNTMMFNSTKESKCEENDSSTACLENQCEQKSVSITDEWIEDYWQHEKVNNPYSYDKGEEIQFDHQGFVRFCKKYCKKPTDEEMKTSEMQKPEPKFKVRDWVVYNTEEWREVLMVDRVDDGIYHLVDVNGETCNAFFEEECNMRLWGIEDAKDGDVLAWDDSKCIALFKNIDDEESFNSYGFVGHCTGIFEPKQSYHDIEGAHPATKEQRGLLFKKMKESGYEWDAEKKELKKIEQYKLTEFEEAVKDMMDNYRDAIGDNNATTEEVKKHSEYLLSLIPHKPTAWSEEDEMNLKQAIYVCHRNGYTAVENWLKYLKPQKHWKPSEYDISLLEEIARKIRTNTKPFCSDISSLEDLIEKLKSL